MPKIQPRSIKEYPEDIIQACPGFMIGDIESLDTREKQEKWNLDHKLPIREAFLSKLRELNYEKLPRSIENLDDALSNEYVFMVFDFTAYPVYNAFLGETLTYWDFHCVRRELDGTWVHKPGWNEPPCEIRSEADWENIYKEFGRKYVLFAFAE